MTFNQLVDFIENKMSMSHIYQPLLIRSLVELGGSATLRNLANVFLSQDESQLTYYEQKVKDMPLKVLRKHQVLSHDGDLVSLNVKKLTFEQKAQLKMLCEQKLQEYTLKKGMGLWDYRMLDTDPVPDSLRYRLLKESGGRCSLCGVTKKERPLDIDHIIPRSKGGKNNEENLQVLCDKCNRSKGNKDDTDFRHDLVDQVEDCPFCLHNLKGRIVAEFDSVVAIEDGYPVTDGHLLIIPKIHTADYFSMPDREKQDSNQLIVILRKRIKAEDPSVTGFNIGVNCGESAGQTIFHCHVHLIPRRDGDVSNPRGGVRGVVPGKMNY